jgi:hypothetical protein
MSAFRGLGCLCGPVVQYKLCIRFNRVLWQLYTVLLVTTKVAIDGEVFSAEAATER